MTVIGFAAGCGPSPLLPVPPSLEFTTQAKAGSQSRSEPLRWIFNNDLEALYYYHAVPMIKGGPLRCRLSFPVTVLSKSLLVELALHHFLLSSHP